MRNMELLFEKDIASVLQFKKQMLSTMNPIENAFRSVMPALLDERNSLTRAAENATRMIDWASVKSAANSIVMDNYKDIGSLVNATLSNSLLRNNWNELGAALSSTYLNDFNSYYGIQSLGESLSGNQEKGFEFPDEEVIVHKDESISCGDQSLSSDELEKHIRKLSEEIRDISYENQTQERGITKEQFFNTITANIKKANNPHIKKILHWFFYAGIHLIFMTMSMLNQCNHMDNKGFDKKIEIKKSKIYIYNEVQDKEQLHKIRIVTKDELPIWHKKKRKSGIVSFIDFGEAVYVIKKDRKWAYIELLSDPTIKGWVWGRYLDKVDNHNQHRYIAPAGRGTA